MTAISIGMPAMAVIMPTGMAVPGDSILPNTDALIRMMLPVIADRVMA